MAENARAVADVDPLLIRQIAALRQQAGVRAERAVMGEAHPWMMPEPGDWSGDLADLEGLSAMFDRRQLADWFDQATADSQAPGTVGDLVVIATQVDYLACMERAFRARHGSGLPRAMCHAAARSGGHGSEHGPLNRMVVDYVTNLSKENKRG